MLIIWPYFSLIVCWVFCRFRTVFGTVWRFILFNIWFRLQLSFQFGWWWSSMKFLPRDIVVLQQNADSLRSLLSPSSSKRFIIWMSLYGQLYYFLKIFRTLRLSSTKLLGLTPHQKQCSVIEWPIYWYTTVTLSKRALTVVWAGYGFRNPANVSGMNGQTICDDLSVLDFSMF